MKKIIVTTTINSPTIATKKFASMKNWQLIVVGDKKTPHKEYEKLDCIYLHPDYQDAKYKELSDAIGWNKIQRRNIGFVEAYNSGADIVATVDDDNIPYEDWGKNILIGKEVEVDTWDTEYSVFDPLSVTNNKSLWHRGYPIENVRYKNKVSYAGKKTINVLIQADLWDGDPDIDAMCRLIKSPIVKFDISKPYTGTKISPFNSQNTFLSRKCLKHYFVYPYIGRMDDIWASYDLQKIFPNSLIYHKASVYQDRNEQDLVKNLEDEIIGYRNTYEYIQGNFALPQNAQKAFKIYQNYFGE
jgi:hypothetical protein